MKRVLVVLIAILPMALSVPAGAGEYSSCSQVPRDDLAKCIIDLSQSIGQ